MHSLSLTTRYQLRNTPIEVFEIIPPKVICELNYKGRAKENILIQRRAMYGRFTQTLSAKEVIN